MAEQVSVTQEIAAPAEQVWAMVSEVTRMGEWSPENEGRHMAGRRDGRTGRREVPRHEPHWQEEVEDCGDGRRR